MTYRYFFTGAPGSRWSGIAQIIEDAGRFDITDRNEDREYSHGLFTGHKGVYFGKQMECEAILSIELLDSFFDSSGPRLIKSHDWAYNLEDVKQFCNKHGDRLILVYRYSLTCLEWWLEAGGFSISYPNYEWYENEDKMFLEIVRQNKAILDFVNSHNLTLVTFDNTWIKNNFVVDKEYDVSNFTDVSIAIL